jgi:subtilisin family serine protease
MQDKGKKEQYLIRMRDASVAQGLSAASVELTPDGRKKQIARLKEFRNDVDQAAFSELRHWIADSSEANNAKEINGLTTNGIVANLTHSEVAALQKDVEGVMLLKNEALTLIPPAALSKPMKQLPQNCDWHLDVISQLAARSKGTAFSGKGVKIAVLDTGVQLNHPELGGRIIGAWKMKAGRREASASDLVTDNSHYDTDGHGTHVAGLIAGKTIGVAPNAELISVLMMPQRKATTFDFAACLDWAASNPEILLVNFSAGVTTFTPSLMDQVADVLAMGVVPFFAIGNDGANKTCSPGNFVDGVSVGSVDSPGTAVSSFSGSAQKTWDNTIYEVPDMVAPGREVWSSYINSNYILMSGTSMAAPIACGVAACFIEKAGGLISPLDLIDELKQKCKPLIGVAPVRQGAGLVQVP